MKFNPGDLVIKSSGGNKMKVVSFNGNGYDCGWFTEKYHEEFFNEEELVSISQYKSSLMNEKRDDLIKKILS